MGRAIGGVVLAFLLWTALWLGFNTAAQAALPEIIDPEQPLTHAGMLLTSIACATRNAVSDRFISAATVCIHSASAGLRSTQIAAGLPAKAVSVKASTK